MIAVIASIIIEDASNIFIYIIIYHRLLKMILVRVEDQDILVVFVVVVVEEVGVYQTLYLYVVYAI